MKENEKFKLIVLVLKKIEYTKPGFIKNELRKFIHYRERRWTLEVQKIIRKKTSDRSIW